MHLQQIRARIIDMFATLPESTGEIDREAVLIRDGQYCGHRFISGRLEAVWFFEEDQIKFRSANGSALMAISPSKLGQLPPSHQQERRAA